MRRRLRLLSCGFVLALISQQGFAAEQAAEPLMKGADPKAISYRFIQLMMAGDEKAALAALQLSNDDSRKEAQAFVGRLIAQRQFKKALSEISGQDFYLGNEDKLIWDKYKQLLETATFRDEGDTATVSCANGPKIFFIWNNKEWKIDFEKSQRSSIGPANALRTQAAAAQAELYRTLTADMRAKKYKSDDDSLDAYDKGLDKVDGIALLGKGLLWDAPQNINRENMADLESAMKLFYIMFDRFPTTAEGLSALVKPPAPHTSDGLCSYVPFDAWGHPYIYRDVSVQGQPKFELISAGPDGKEGTADDIKLSGINP